MLTFPDSFFEEEIRCDFVVPEKMKRAWAAEMDVLAEVIAACQKHHIPYFAEAGTLLGAVRHKGFIPWDDDIDIALKRKDYQKLLALLPGELPESYVIYSLYNSAHHGEPHTSIVNHRTILTDTRQQQQFYGCPYIAGIDIFPLDYIPRDPELKELQLQLYNIVYGTARRYHELENTPELDTYLSRIEDFCNVTFDCATSIQQQLWLLCERISSMFSEEESDSLVWFLHLMYLNRELHFDKTWYAHSVELPFEQLSISVPWKYKEVLSARYGDYETPVYYGSDHTYPFYKKQDEYLNRH